MRLLILAFFSLSFLACIEEYSDSIILHNNGGATFLANIYPWEPDTNTIELIKGNYDSTAGLKFDSAWFSQKDSLYSLHFMLTFENLLDWQGNKKFEKDFLGNISLKKIDSLKNGYSFERIINSNTENENGEIVPEESIPPFVLEQMFGNDSTYWEYTLVLPQGAMLVSSDPIDPSYIDSGILRWKILAGEAFSKRISLRADFVLPDAPQGMDRTSLIGAIAGCIVMLLAIALLIRKLVRISLTLKKLENAEKDLKGE